MAKGDTLAPAAELARDNAVRIPNENADYRAARTALLAEEIELRRHIERVAAQRRALPPGGAVTGNYRFQGENGPTEFAFTFKTTFPPNDDFQKGINWSAFLPCPAI